MPQENRRLFSWISLTPSEDGVNVGPDREAFVALGLWQLGEQVGVAQPREVRIDPPVHERLLCAFAVLGLVPQRLRPFVQVRSKPVPCLSAPMRALLVGETGDVLALATAGACRAAGC